MKNLKLLCIIKILKKLVISGCTFASILNLNVAEIKIKHDVFKFEDSLLLLHKPV